MGDLTLVPIPQISHRIPHTRGHRPTGPLSARPLVGLARECNVFSHGRQIDFSATRGYRPQCALTTANVVKNGDIVTELVTKSRSAEASSAQ